MKFSESDPTPQKDSTPRGPRGTRRLILLPAFLSVVALLAIWVGVEKYLSDSETVSSLLFESWDMLSIEGVRVGGSHTRQWQADQDGQLRKITESTEYLRVLRQGQSIYLEVTYRCEETPAGELLACSSRQQTNDGPMIVQTAQVVGDQLQLQQQMASSQSTRSIEWPNHARGYFGIEESLRQQMLVPDERRTLKYLVPLVNQLAEVDLHAGQFEAIELTAGLTRLLRIEVTTRRAGLTSHRTLWCDGAGAVIRSFEPTMKITSEQTSREVAQWHSPMPHYDIMVDSLVPIDPPIGTPLEQSELVYQVQLRDDSPAEIFAQDDRQKVESLNNRQALLSVRAAWLKKGVRTLLPELPGGYFAQKSPDPFFQPEAANLAPSHYIQSDDPQIIALAERVSLDTEAAGKGPLALGLERLVHDWIHDKDLQQVFASARDVCESRRGDCTEHAVLLAAVCRARKLPARLVVGLIYVPEQQGFLFHLWTEVWWDQHWHGLDATMGRGGIGATHLKLHAFTLANDNPLADMAAVSQVIGQLEIEVVESGELRVE
ncbi:MAG: transglutaminase-like domain-containing protein [Pirellulales bacterium]